MSSSEALGGEDRDRLFSDDCARFGGRQARDLRAMVEIDDG